MSPRRSKTSDDSTAHTDAVDISGTGGDGGRGDGVGGSDDDPVTGAQGADGSPEAAERDDDTAELPVVPTPTGHTMREPHESETAEVRRAADLAEVIGLARMRYDRDTLLDKANLEDMDTARWWRAMGIVEVPDGMVAFNADDLAMARALKVVLAEGDASEEHVFRLARLLGGSFSRIAEAQTAVVEDMIRSLDPGVALDTPGERSAALSGDAATALVNLFEQSMLYVWRRHLFATLGRWVGADPEHEDQAVGFVDISDFSRMSKRLDPDVLAIVVEGFESEVVDVVSAHGGRVVKFIGDEAFFVLDDLGEAVRTALEIMERLEASDPPVALHGAVASGPTVTIAGDVFGNTVNLAKRLTDVARKGKVILPKDQAKLLEDCDDLRLHRVGRSFELKGVGRTSAMSVSLTPSED
ncbi:MAG: hypothetical protein ACK5O2_17195 [Microthrixaceae bacterium]